MDKKMRGKFVPIVGPTGSGKDTLVNHILSVYPDTPRSISCTTRTMRAGEADGVDYYFLAREEFERKVAAGDFLEWAEYGGNLYGTLKEELEQYIAEGQLVTGDIEIQGVRLIRDLLPETEFATIYIDAGPWEVVEARVLARGPMSEEDLAKRRARYEEESRFKSEATYIVKNPNGGLEQAKEDIVAVIAGIRRELGLPA